jgi:hypothetical protein
MLSFQFSQGHQILKGLPQEPPHRQPPLPMRTRLNMITSNHPTDDNGLSPNLFQEPYKTLTTSTNTKAIGQFQSKIP